MISKCQINIVNQFIQKPEDLSAILLGRNHLQLRDKYLLSYIITKFMSKQSKRGWSAQEDQLLQRLVEQSETQKTKWTQIASTLQKQSGRIRTGKQCRERWQHQLNPSIVKEDWLPSQQLELFKLHVEHGNKWCKIAEFLPGRSSNAVKNYFYCTIRRVFTKINLILVKHRGQQEFKFIREFESDFISKLMAVVDGNFSKKIRLVNDDAAESAKNILQRIAKLSVSIDDAQYNTKQMVQMILTMHEFRKNCRKKRQRNDLQKSQGHDSNEVSSSSREKKGKYESPSRSIEDDGSSNSNKKNQMVEEQPHKIITDFTGPFKMNHQQIQDQLGQPTQLFKLFADPLQIRRENWWQIQPFDEAQVMKGFLYEQEKPNYWSERLYQFPQSQERNFLQSSQMFDQKLTVTNLKRTDSSLAPEEGLLNHKKSSYAEYGSKFS